MAQSELSCPNCGSGVSPGYSHVRMTTCESCGTSIYLEDEVFHLAGEAGVMHDGPMLFDIGDRVAILGREYQILGHARFSYGPGWWDEFWSDDGQGEGAWISIDEGDVVVQTKLKEGFSPIKGTPRLGQIFKAMGQGYRVSEMDQATCMALRGSLPERMIVGETYNFINCTGDDGALLSGEIWEGGQNWHMGYWVDPFEVRVSA